jgi:hypothetical protein
MKLLLLGATGLVGKTLLNQALATTEISAVVAPTRRPLAPQPKLANLVVDRLDDLAPQLPSWNVDAVLCALGTTMAKAGSKEAFRYVDYILPLVFAKEAHAAGVNTFALVSAIGASATSMFFNPKTKGRMGEGHQADRPSVPHHLQTQHHRRRQRRIAICRRRSSRLGASDGTYLAEKVSHQSRLCNRSSLAPLSPPAKSGCRLILAEELN